MSMHQRGSHQKQKPGLKLTAAVALVCSAACFLVGTWRWPLTGDAALMHYVCFLMQHGRVPYKDIVDINLPGSYLPNWLLQRFFGPSALALRLYDVALLAVIGLGSCSIMKPRSRFAALWAACLFAVIHGRDGIEQAAERDLLIAALLVAGVAMLCRAKRRDERWPAFLFGLAIGMALTVKPTTVLFLSIPVVDLFVAKGERDQAGRRLLAAVIGWLVPPAICAVWLLRHGSMHAFVYDITVLARYHSRFGHVPLHFLLYVSVSPVLPLVIVCGVLWLLRRRGSVAERALLFAGDAGIDVLLWTAAFAAFLSYVVQRRAYLYQRYPFLIFLLLILALEMEANLASRGVRQWLTVAAMLWSSFGLAPMSAWKAVHYRGAVGTLDTQLEDDLRALGSSDRLGRLDGRVQCLDTVSGCISALEHLQFMQASGFLYDEFLFHPPDNTVVQDARRAFFSQMKTAPPVIFVVSDPFFPPEPGHEDKLLRWPEFNDWLNRNYAVAVTNEPSVSIQTMGKKVLPAGYRIYQRRSF